MKSRNLVLATAKEPNDPPPGNTATASKGDRSALATSKMQRDDQNDRPFLKGTRSLSCVFWLLVDVRLDICFNLGDKLFDHVKGSGAEALRSHGAQSTIIV